MSRGVNWKILRLSKVLLQYTEKGGDDCFDVIHGFVDKLSYKRTVVIAQKTDILNEVSYSGSFRFKYLSGIILNIQVSKIIDRNKCLCLHTKNP
jgi:hypothetical protein